MQELKTMHNCEPPQRLTTMKKEKEKSKTKKKNEENHIRFKKRRTTQPQATAKQTIAQTGKAGGPDSFGLQRPLSVAHMMGFWGSHCRKMLTRSSLKVDQKDSFSQELEQQKHSGPYGEKDQ